jgi:hypothetical protein
MASITRTLTVLGRLGAAGITGGSGSPAGATDARTAERVRGLDPRGRVGLGPSVFLDDSSSPLASLWVSVRTAPLCGAAVATVKRGQNVDEGEIYTCLK